MPFRTITQPSDLKNTIEQREIRSASDLKGLTVQRNIVIKREAINEETRTVDLAFASETPVERYYGYEILDCRPESVRLNRLNSRAPILVDHNPRDQVGVIENATMDKDRIGRVQSRYSRSSRGQEIFQDIVDEIRTCTSVGYVIHDAVLERTEDGENYYRITDWEPYEVSIVSMPADCSVGVGRSMETNNEPEQPETKPPQKEKRTMKCQHCGAELAEGATCTCGAVRAGEQKRVTDIMIRAGEFSTRGGMDVAADLLKEKPGATVDDFNARMLQKITETQAKPTTREPSPAMHTTASLRYDRRSLEPFKRALSAESGISAERAAYIAGMWARAVIWGDQNAERWCTDNNISVRVMTEGVGSAGGFLVPEPLENAIIDLRAEYGLFRQLAEYWPLGSAAITIPVRKTGTTAYFVGEDEETTESDLSWGEADLIAKEVSALSRFSMSLAEDAIIDIGAKVAEEHAYAFAVKEDECGINGDGTKAYGGIVGLKMLLEAAGMKGIYTCAVNTDKPEEVIASEISGLMGKLPSYARRGAVFCASPTFDEMIFSRLMAAGGGNTTITLSGEIAPAYLGKPRKVCEPCYSDPTADMTGKAMLFYGNFKQGIAFGERRGITIQVLRELYAKKRQIGVIGTERIDINCHGVGDATAAGPVVALIGG